MPIYCRQDTLKKNKNEFELMLKKEQQKEMAIEIKEFVGKNNVKNVEEKKRDNVKNKKKSKKENRSDKTNA